MHKLVTAYIRLVVAIASRFKIYGLPMADLIQEGNIGLMTAVAKFDANRNLRFSTYASWWIRAQIQDYVLRNWSIVRLGSTASQKSLFFNFNRLKARIDNTGGKTLDDGGRAKIAQELRVPMRDVERVEKRLFAYDYSLSHTLSEDSEATAQDFLADESPSPESAVIGKSDRIRQSHWLQQALRQLSPRERRIIVRRKLIHDADTLETLGAEMGVSKERVRQLENRAMQKIESHLRQNVETPQDLF